MSAIPKSVTPARLRENLEATELTLTPSELERVAALDQGYRIIAGTFWAVAGTPWTLQTIWDEP